MCTSALDSRTPAGCQSLLLSALLTCAWIFHDHLFCSSAADLSLGTDPLVYPAETQTYGLLISLTGFHILLNNMTI